MCFMVNASTYNDRGYYNDSSHNIVKKKPDKGTSSNPYVIDKNTSAEDRNITLRYNTKPGSSGNQRVVETNGKMETVTVPKTVVLKSEDLLAMPKSISSPNKTVVFGAPGLGSRQVEEVNILFKQSNGKVSLNQQGDMLHFENMNVKNNDTLGFSSRFNNPNSSNNVSADAVFQNKSLGIGFSRAPERPNTGYSVPGGAQGFFTRTNMFFGRVENKVIGFFPNEQKFKDFSGTGFGKSVYSVEGSGVGFTSVVSREKAVGLGSYLLPIYGGIKFSSDIGTLGEKGKYGEAIALSSLVYVPLGVKASKSAYSFAKDFNDYNVLRNKFNGDFLVETNGKDVSRLRDSNLFANVKPVEGVRFGVVQTSEGRSSYYKVLLGESQRVHVSSIPKNDFYVASLKGEKFVDLASKDGNVDSLVSKGFDFNQFHRESVSNSFVLSNEGLGNVLRSNNLGRFDSGFKESGVRSVQGVFSFEGKNFGEGSSLVRKDKPAIFRSLTMSKPLSNFESGYFVEKGLAIKPSSGYRDGLLNDLVVNVNRVSSNKIYFVQDIIKPSRDVGFFRGSRGGLVSETVLRSESKGIHSSLVSSSWFGGIGLVGRRSKVSFGGYSEFVSPRKPLVSVEDVSSGKVFSDEKFGVSAKTGVFGLNNSRSDVRPSFFPVNKSNSFLKSDSVVKNSVDFNIKSDSFSKSISVNKSINKNEISSVNKSELRSELKSSSLFDARFRSGFDFGNKLEEKSFVLPFFDIPSSKKKKFKSIKSRKFKFGKRVGGSGVFVLPDLFSVNLTEARNYSRFGGGEAVAPRLTKDIYRKSIRAFNGFGGFIPTEQIRTGNYKPVRLKI